MGYWQFMYADNGFAGSFNNDAVLDWYTEPKETSSSGYWREDVDNKVLDSTDFETFVVDADMFTLDEAIIMAKARFKNRPNYQSIKKFAPNQPTKANKEQ